MPGRERCLSISAKLAAHSDLSNPPVRHPVRQCRPSLPALRQRAGALQHQRREPVSIVTGHRSTCLQVWPLNAGDLSGVMSRRPDAYDRCPDLRSEDRRLLAHYQPGRSRKPAYDGGEALSGLPRRVMINGAYSGPGVRRGLSHRKSHSGCPLKPETYCGTPSQHPQALS